jgi:hypothetical protein
VGIKYVIFFSGLGCENFIRESEEGSEAERRRREEGGGGRKERRGSR